MATMEPQKLERHAIAKLTEKRKQQQLSYGHLAELTGLHRTSISLIERGKTHPTLFVCLKLAKALGLSPHDLFSQESSPKPAKRR